MSELYIPPERPGRNFVTGRFLKGNAPHNKGKKWADYIDGRKIRRMLKGLELGRKGKRNIGGWNKRTVVAIKEGSLMGVYPSTSEAERKTGICSRNIRSCCSGKRKHAGDYQWFWENDNKWCNLINQGEHEPF